MPAPRGEAGRRELVVLMLIAALSRGGSLRPPSGRRGAPLRDIAALRRFECPPADLLLFVAALSPEKRVPMLASPAAACGQGRRRCVATSPASTPAARGPRRRRWPRLSLAHAIEPSRDSGHSYKATRRRIRVGTAIIARVGAGVRADGERFGSAAPAAAAAPAHPGDPTAMRSPMRLPLGGSARHGPPLPSCRAASSRERSRGTHRAPDRPAGGAPASHRHGEACPSCPRSLSAPARVLDRACARRRSGGRASTLRRRSRRRARTRHHPAARPTTLPIDLPTTSRASPRADREILNATYAEDALTYLLADGSQALHRRRPRVLSPRASAPATRRSSSMRRTSCCPNCSARRRLHARWGLVTPVDRASRVLYGRSRPPTRATRPARSSTTARMPSRPRRLQGLQASRSASLYATTCASPPAPAAPRSASAPGVRVVARASRLASDATDRLRRQDVPAARARPARRGRRDRAGRRRAMSTPSSRQPRQRHRSTRKLSRPDSADGAPSTRSAGAQRRRPRVDSFLATAPATSSAAALPRAMSHRRRAYALLSSDVARRKAREHVMHGRRSSRTAGTGTGSGGSLLRFRARQRRSRCPRSRRRTPRRRRPDRRQHGTGWSTLALRRSASAGRARSRRQAVVHTLRVPASHPRPTRRSVGCVPDARFSPSLVGPAGQRLGPEPGGSRDWRLFGGRSSAACRRRSLANATTTQLRAAIGKERVAEGRARLQASDAWCCGLGRRAFRTHVSDRSGSIAADAIGHTTRLEGGEVLDGELTASALRAASARRRSFPSAPRPSTLRSTWPPVGRWRRSRLRSRPPTGSSWPAVERRRVRGLDLTGRSLRDSRMTRNDKSGRAASGSRAAAWRAISSRPIPPRSLVRSLGIRYSATILPARNRIERLRLHASAVSWSPSPLQYLFDALARSICIATSRRRYGVPPYPSDLHAGCALT